MSTKRHKSARQEEVERDIDAIMALGAINMGLAGITLANPINSKIGDEEIRHEEIEELTR